MNAEENLLYTLKEIRIAPDNDSVLKVLTDFTSEFGFNYVIISQFLNPSVAHPPSWVSANNWPAELLAQRRKNKAHLHDPVVRMGLHAHCPFNWEDARAISSDEGRKVMDEAAAHGLKHGMMFPLRMADLPPGGVSMGGRGTSLSRQEQSLLELAAREAYLRLLELAGPKELYSCGRLSRRESQILTMIAEGHNNQAVANMLGICPDTVKDTLTRCYRKLGVSNRSAAVKQALMTLQILPLPNAYTPLIG